MTGLTDVPNEILLKFFAELELKDLIRARAVCSQWLDLIPFAPMPSARKRLFDFYLELVASSLFSETRTWVLKYAKPFDGGQRQAYLDKLSAAYTPLPEEFRLWVLEWPSRAIIGGIWPGLPRNKYVAPHFDYVNVRPGTPWIVFPQISALILVDRVNNIVDYIPAIVIHRSLPGYGYDTWLLLDQRGELKGKVLEDASDRVELAPEIIGPRVHADWIAYLRETWIEIEGKASDLQEFKDQDVAGKDGTEIPSAELHELRTPAWQRRNSPDTQRLLSSTRKYTFGR